MRRHVLPLAAAALVAVPALALVPAPANAHHWSQAPGVAPPGTNDPDCTSDHEPVILVHGTLEDMTQNWAVFGPALRAAGYCPWALDLPDRASVDLETTVEALADFTWEVLATTGAEEVAMVGHSQGGMQIRHLVLHAVQGDPGFDGLETRVTDAVSLSGSHQGTEEQFHSGQHADDTPHCRACSQQKAGHPFYTDHLNAGELTPGTANYTQIQTEHDEIVQPYENAFLPPADADDEAQVTNVLLQDACPWDPSEHLTIHYDPVALEWTLHALETPGPADPDFVPASCGGLAGP